MADEPMDYAGNAKKNKVEKPDKPEKAVERVISGPVVVKKKSIGEKVKDLFIEADFKNVARYVVYEVLLPAARNTIVDASTKGIERMMYGESAIRRKSYGIGPRITYNSPINRGYREGIPRTTPPPPPRASHHAREEFILSSREEAELVLERMTDIIDNYETVSVADLNDLVGFPTSHIDNKWGWQDLTDVQVRQIRDGYLIDLPQPEPL
jgi:hypothetical protein